jgi:hypothetical protein
MQGLTDGHKTIIGHHTQKHVIHTSKQEEKRHLSSATCIRDDSALSLNVHDHIWDCGGAKTNVSQSQVVEEEVHGGVEVGVTADAKDDEQIAKHCDQVHGQEQAKQDGLKFWNL